MRPTWLILGVLLLAPLATAQEPNHRDDLILEHGGLDVGISRDGKFLAVSLTDDGSTTPSVEGPGKDQLTWLYFEVLGESYNQRKEGGTDPEACDEPVVVSDDCNTPSPLLALSAGGDRLVVVGRPDGSSSEVIFTSITGSSVLHQASINGRVVAIDADDNMDTVVLGIERDDLMEPGRVQVWDWGGWDDNDYEPEQDDFEAAITALDMSRDGSRVAVAAGDEFISLRPGSTASPFDDGWNGNPVQAVAQSDSSSHVAIAGDDRGTLRFYIDVGSSSTTRDLNLAGSQDAVTALAIRKDATQIAIGHASGRLVVRPLDPSIMDVGSKIVDRDLGDAIQDLEYSADGKHLAVAFEDELALWAADGTVERLWNESYPSALEGFSMSEDASSIAVVFGTTLRLYEAEHDVAISAAGPEEIIPGEDATYIVTLSNTGDRRESGTLEVDSPWDADIEDPEVSLAPGETETVPVALDVPSDHAAGDLELVFRLKGERTFSITKDVTVPSYEAWELSPDGSPTSLPIEGGEAAVFDLVLRNAGNIDKQAPLELDVSPGSWTATIREGDGVIEAGETVTLSIALEAPADAAQLAQGRVIVSLEGNDDIELVGTVGARFGVGLDLPERVLVTPGEEATFSITVRNTGNAPDSFRLDAGALPSGWSLTFDSGGSSTTVRDVAAGGQKTIQARITVPEDATGPPVEMAVEAVSLADSEESTAKSMAFQLETDSTTTSKGDNGSPGAGTALVGLALLSAALVAARRRS